MPHVDELLGPVTFAAAGLFAAIALQPGVPGSPAQGARDAAPAASARSVSGTAQVVRLPAVEVVASRRVELARLEREEQLARERQAKAASRPNV
ncbi:hypothetical protein BURK1_03163 [Burkholderiales bacterium]|nr:hypothetical protein BURK1_03163 [Burkholderiales bacterium]